MRSLAAAAILFAGCFSIPADEQPTHSTHHIDLLKDAGRWDVGATPADAGPPPQRNCGNMTCEENTLCLMLGDPNGAPILDCLEPRPNEAADSDLTSLLSQICVETPRENGPGCNNGRCDDQHFQGCIDQNGSPTCYREYGPCKDTQDCNGRGGNNGHNMACQINPEWQRELVEALRGRCAPAGMGYEALVSGAIGFWAVKDGSKVCGLAPCSDGDPGASCGHYLTDEPHGGFRDAIADVHEPFAVCGGIPGNDSADPKMCDWRECGETSECQRKYMIKNVECTQDGWCRAAGIFLNEFAHGTEVGEAQTGTNRCWDVCHEGQVCELIVINAEATFSCIGCSGDGAGQCPEGASCIGGHCRYSCDDDDGCIWEERCNTQQGGYCEHSNDHGPGPPPNGRCAEQGDSYCGANKYCQEVMIRGGDGRPIWQPVCQESSCTQDADCWSVPGSVCHNNECRTHGLCRHNDDCAPNDSCTTFPNANTEDLCLDLTMPVTECSSDPDCAESPGEKCIFGRLCGSFETDSECSDILTVYQGYCPNPVEQQPNGPCSGEGPNPCHNQQSNPNCTEVHINVNNRNESRAACTPTRCSEAQIQCPVAFLCKVVEGQPDNDRCEFAGLCNHAQECGDDMRCETSEASGMTHHCFDLQSQCTTDPDCDGNSCIAGFCAGPQSSESCTGNDKAYFAGVCRP